MKAVYERLIELVSGECGIAMARLSEMAHGDIPSFINLDFLGDIAELWVGLPLEARLIAILLAEYRAGCQRERQQVFLIFTNNGRNRFC